MVEIEFHNVSKVYKPGLFKKNVAAVTELSLDVFRGEVLGLIGPNGAGKSTTIRLLLGLIRPDEGEIIFQGKPLRHAAVQRKAGYLPENPYLYDHLTLIELLTFCGKTSGLSATLTNSRTSELLAKMNLTHASKRPLRTFSKGMLQRAGICFALLHDPSVVILDEPMSGLDPIGRKMVFDLVMELKNQGKTVFFCSHILSDVERLCDRIYLMDGGRLVRRFTREDLPSGDESQIYLSTNSLSQEQLLVIEPLCAGVYHEVEGDLLGVLPENLAPLVACLQNHNIAIQDCRPARIDLEELFMQTIKEQRK